MFLMGFERGGYRSIFSSRAVTASSNRDGSIIGVVIGEVVLEDATGLHRAPALLVPPLWRHRLHPAAFLRTVFVEPHCALAVMLRAQASAGITAAPFAEQWGEALLRAEGSRPSALLDRRLQQAMQLLAEDEESMSAVARRCGLSAVHLRALAREQLGMPLAPWRIWQRWVAVCTARLDRARHAQAHHW